MKTKSIPCICIGIILLTAAARRQDAADERKLLQGTWLPIAAELSENPFGEATLKIMKLVIEGDKYNVTVGISVDMGTIRIDPAAKPKTMDVTGTFDGTTTRSLAIYEVRGNTLKYASGGNERPSSFDKLPAGGVLFVFKRAKP